MKEINAYLIFNGNCREAMTFYQQCLGADLQLAPFSDMPGGNIPKEARDRTMHARLTKGAAVLLASDNMVGMPFQQGDNFSIALQCESAQETEELFNALSAKGTITMPLQETFWAARFGMFKDQFGIHWMLNFEKPVQK
ncbi:MAG TPA: VOC family protein [Candidatus Angelobacter sp.]|nr:VOC family protein [Candidatus Angelobacter sp.]